MRMTCVSLYACFLCLLMQVASQADGAIADIKVSALLNAEVLFVPNHGQENPEVKFTADVRGAKVYFTDHSLIFKGVTMAFGDPRVACEIQAEEMEETRFHFYQGSDPSTWIVDTPSYKRIRYRDVYKGIDVVFYGSGGELEQDFIVHPGANPSQVSIDFEGVLPKVDSKGNVKLGDLVLHKPVAYQHPGSQKKDPDARFSVLGGKQIRFAIDEYDPDADLIIDPVIQFSSPLGVQGPMDVTLDNQGNIIVVGQTISQHFPGENGKLRAKFLDAFALKFRPNGQVLFAALLGGTERDSATAVALDRSGNIFVAGWTDSRNFPTTPGAYDRKCGTDGKCNPFRGAPNPDAFVAKLSSTGKLIYSTYLGGPDDDVPNDVVVDSQGNCIATLFTLGPFPLVHPLFSEAGGVVAKLNASGSALLFSTYMPLASADAIALDSHDNILAAGMTSSSNLPVVNAFQDTMKGERDCYILEMDPDGGSVLFSSYLGGRGSETTERIVVDKMDNAILTGETFSNDFPLNNALQATRRGKGDAFITKFRTDGTGVVFSTYWGGSKDEFVTGVDVDPPGNVYLVGHTASPNLRLKNALQGKLNKGGTVPAEDAFLLKLDPSGRQILYSTYFGGHKTDLAFSVKAGKNGATYVVGTTNSSDFTYVRPFMPPMGDFILKISPASH